MKISVNDSRVVKDDDGQDHARFRNAEDAAWYVGYRGGFDMVESLRFDLDVARAQLEVFRERIHEQNIVIGALRAQVQPEGVQVENNALINPSAPKKRGRKPKIQLEFAEFAEPEPTKEEP